MLIVLPTSYTRRAQISIREPQNTTIENSPFVTEGFILSATNIIKRSTKMITK